MEVLEKSVQEMKAEHRGDSAQVLGAVESLRRDFKGELEKSNERIEIKLSTLHTQIDSVTNNHTNLRLSVQKLAGTVSVVVGVGLYILKAVFDAAKDAFLAQ